MNMGVDPVIRGSLEMRHFAAADNSIVANMTMAKEIVKRMVLLSIPSASQVTMQLGVAYVDHIPQTALFSD